MKSMQNSALFSGCFLFFSYSLYASDYEEGRDTPSDAYRSSSDADLNRSGARGSIEALLDDAIKSAESAVGSGSDSDSSASGEDMRYVRRSPLSGIPPTVASVEELNDDSDNTAATRSATETYEEEGDVRGAVCVVCRRHNASRRLTCGDFLCGRCWVQCANPSCSRRFFPGELASRQSEQVSRTFIAGYYCAERCEFLCPQCREIIFAYFRSPEDQITPPVPVELSRIFPENRLLSSHRYAEGYHHPSKMRRTEISANSDIPQAGPSTDYYDFTEAQ